MRVALPRAGFTLIELLVAIAILALLAVLSWRGLDSVLRARSALSQELAFSRALQTTFNQLDADLRSAARDVGTQTELPGVKFTAGQLLILRYQFGSPGAGRWELVRYSVQDSQLQRHAAPLNTWVDLQRWQNLPQAWQSLEPQSLVSNIRNLSWQVAGQQGFVLSDATSVQSASQAQNMGVPNKRLAVRLTLEMNSGERFVRQWGIRE
jgi:general secretion pathway protein J